MSPDRFDVPAVRGQWDQFLDTRCSDELDRARRVATALVANPPSGALAVLEDWNQVTLALLNATTVSNLLGLVHPDRSLREGAKDGERSAAAVQTELEMDRDLYDLLASVDRSGLDEAAARMLDCTLRDFRRAGVDQDPSTRERLRTIVVSTMELAQAFERNITDDVRTVSVRADQLDGMPDDFVETHPPDDDGFCVLSTDWPDVIPISDYCADGSVRADLVVALMNRGSPANEAVLQELIALRHERASLLGYDSWNDFDAEVKMAGTRAAVAEFIAAAAEAARQPARHQTARLLNRLRQDQPQAETLAASDAFYYTEIIRREDYGVDGQIVREYLGFDRVRDGLLAVTGRLFGLSFIAQPDAGRWHEDVAVYDVHSEDRHNELLGRIYLDLHPRDGKIKDGAHVPLAKGVAGTQMPHSALVCNLPRGLMSHDDVVVLFHEFGHLIHALIGGAQKWARFSGVATERDFIEAPSQMLEEWAWNPGVLQTFAINDEGEPIPADLVTRMQAAKDVNKARQTRADIFYAAISHGLYHDQPDDITTYIEHLRTHHEVDPMPGAVHHTSFAHLAMEKYSCAYYTYMWSLVIAKDLFTAFNPDQLLEIDVAHRYRDTVLAPGGSQPAASLVAGFLGRPFNLAAFDAWLSGATD